jgi:hypothetical protein
MLFYFFLNPMVEEVQLGKRPISSFLRQALFTRV